MEAIIVDQKAIIERAKVNIEGYFTAKTAANVCRLLEAFGFQLIFGRSCVQAVLGLGKTRCSLLLNELAENGFIEPVSGCGKGKYRFKTPQG